MNNCRFLTYHGWGFNNRCWNKWENELNNYGDFESFNRGYFGDPLEPDFTGREEFLMIFTHSMGLHHCPSEAIRKADILVIFGGFLQFHPQSAQFKRRSRLILQQMINDFEVQPEKVLESFYKNCYAPADPPEMEIGNYNHELLFEDLKKLHDSRIDINLLEQAGNVIILHGADDAIVPKTKGREIYNRLQQKESHYFEVKMGGHALPFTHFDQSLGFLKSHFEQYLKLR